MRLIFYIFLICQFLNLFSVLAEKIKDDSTQSNQVKWEKVGEGNSNSLKKIFWKPYKDDENYLRKDHQEDHQEGHHDEKI